MSSLVILAASVFIDIVQINTQTQMPVNALFRNCRRRGYNMVVMLKHNGNWLVFNYNFNT